MRKQIIVTLVLLLAAAFLTISYFKNLSLPGMRSSEVLQRIPDNAALIFQYSNDKSFYDIFRDNTLFDALAGNKTIELLDTLNKELLHNPLFNNYFNGQNIFISVHPSKTGPPDLLFTANAPKGFSPDVIGEFNKTRTSGFVITPLTVKNAKGFVIFINDLKRRFYFVFGKNDIISAGFSRQLVEEAVNFKPVKGQALFKLPPEQQRNNALANCYVNYRELNAFFVKDNTDILKGLRSIPGTATLTLNYRTDALMFNGITVITHDKHPDYLTVFSNQQPVDNHLMDLFPATTAYSVSFGISDPVRFKKQLSQWEQTTGVSNDVEQLFKKIKTETGLDIRKNFYNLMANEFAIITTRYFEKLAIVSVKDGTKLKVLLSGVSKMSDEKFGVLSYDKVPSYLLGNPFNIFRHPCYTILDNYLVFANTESELASYRDTYLNQKFLSKNNQYNQFNTLPAERSNVNYFFNFKNAQPLMSRDLPEIAKSIFKREGASWSEFYAASWQLSAADDDFYTNFCISLDNATLLHKKITDSTVHNP